MPKRVSGVTTRLLSCAKAEFLAKGFQNASIREIAKKAETSSRAVYTRFPNKEGLFDAIVDPVVNDFIKIYKDFAETYWDNYGASTDPPSFTSDPTEIYMVMIDYIYDHLTEFKLIMNCLEGTRYHWLIDQLTVRNLAHLETFSIQHRKHITNYDAMTNLLHMLTHSFYLSMFEPLLHDMKREDARFYVRKLCDFFVCGVQGMNMTHPLQ